MTIAMSLLILTIIITILEGVYFNMKKEGMNITKKGAKKTIIRNIATVAGMLVLALITSVNPAFAAEAANASVGGAAASGGYIGAGIAAGCAFIGAGIAVALNGSAALGAVSEDPKMLGKSLIFIGLAEGVAIYGIIIAIMIMNRL